MILVQWRAVGTVGHSDGSSTEGPIKSLHRITVGHLLGTVTDELWEILAHTHTQKHTQPLSRWFQTGGRCSAHFNVREIWFGSQRADVCDEVMLHVLLFYALYPYE